MGILSETGSQQIDTENLPRLSFTYFASRQEVHVDSLVPVNYMFQAEVCRQNSGGTEQSEPGPGPPEVLLLQLDRVCPAPTLAVQTQN